MIAQFIRNAFYMFALASILLASYLLANEGEPSSHWLWCTTMELCP